MKTRPDEAPAGVQRSEVAVVDAVLRSRRSVRQFLPTPVPRETLEEILDLAARAANGSNIQPWHVHVLTGETLKRVTRAVLRELGDPALAKTHAAVFETYPAEWRSPYYDRRKKLGLDMYRLLGIPKGDQAAMQRQAARNYAFFDAPVGLIFALDRLFVPGSALDLGCFMANLMTAARARGLDTCPQAAWGIVHRIVARELPVPENHVVMCGMSLGHADRAAAIDPLATDRIPAAEFARFYD